MKKLLSVLAMTTFSVGTLSSTVSCMPQKSKESKKNPLKIGLDIDKSKVTNSSVDPKTHHGFTNYYVIGDSLSDVDGLTTYVKDKFFVSTGLDSKVDFNLNLDGSYGFKDNDGKHHNAFSNGPTTAYNIANQLGFGPLQPSNKYSKVKENETFGRNYSIGGATAAKIAPQAGGILLNDVSIEEQARTLVAQQKISSNDLVFFEIGGNDLFSMITSQQSGNDAAVIKYMNDSIVRLRNALFTLLNNGIQNIFFLGPPIMDNIPRYAKEDDKEKQRIIDLGKEFEIKMQSVVKEVQSYYGDKLVFSSLYEGENSFPIMQKEYGELIKNEGIIENDDQYHSNESFTKDIKIKINNSDISKTINEFKNYFIEDNIKNYLNFDGKKELNVLVELEGKEGWSEYEQRDEAMKKYFFTDIVHPTKHAHEYVSDKLLKEILKEFK
ncbi:SGNH/GDSL hydrolase family protein [Spiroplasma sp. BIUS-1]|uniref:SGNH/GDSL hydrolase family protein n=1 Tax=Spiroplasma sp. BIUS-1 TaxID=216964 RepID=UPI001397685F|nr:SGNH/GDSL hydrolase family protein [Spiroplasma sp. BIUS-1]QHX36602.1 lipolytic enzyme [Spiroplasma sp. BIUS-1]